MTGLESEIAMVILALNTVRSKEPACGFEKGGRRGLRLGKALLPNL
jgi:hypothetical protein